MLLDAFLSSSKLKAILMKNSNRNVIVEYKNRRVRKSVNSLWGSLDLKLIAQSVEDDTSEQSASVTSEASTECNLGNSTLPEEVTAEICDTEAHNGQPSVIKSAHERTPHFDDKMQEMPLKPARPRNPDQSDIGTSARRKSTSPRQKSLALASKMDQAASLPTDQASRDELAALQAENTVLKRNLIVRLLEENIQLKQMLSRLEALQKPVP